MIEHRNGIVINVPGYKWWRVGAAGPVVVKADRPRLLSNMMSLPPGVDTVSLPAPGLSWDAAYIAGDFITVPRDYVRLWYPKSSKEHRSIFLEFWTGLQTQEQLSCQYGVSVSTIRRICSGKHDWWYL